MKVFKIVMSYILGLILFLLLNLTGILFILKNTFNEKALTEIVNNINIYDIVVGKFTDLSELDLNNNSSISDVFKKVAKESNLDSNTVEFILTNDRVKEVLTESTVNIILSNYKNKNNEINLEKDRIENTIYETFEDYEVSTGVNIEDNLRKAFNEKISYYIGKIEEKLKSMDTSSLILNEKLFLDEQTINKVNFFLFILIFVDLVLIIILNYKKKFLINIGIPLLGTSIIGISIGLLRKFILCKFTMEGNFIKGIIYSIFKYSFNYIFSISLILFSLAIIFIILYHVYENKD